MTNDTAIRRRWRAKLRAARALILRALRVIHRHKTAPAPALIVMFDSININTIPADAPAVAGYVNGKWPTYASLFARFPNAKKLSIATNATVNAECLDVEPGDAIPSQAPVWGRRQQKRGVKRPVFYADLSDMVRLVPTLDKAGYARSDYRLWSAHPTGKAHLCTAACFRSAGLVAPKSFGTADATQHSFHAFGRNLDQSLCNGGFFS